MTHDEAQDESFSLLADLLGLDEFQRIAARELLDGIGEINFPDVAPEQEQKLMSLGAICSETLGFPDA